MSKVKYLKQTEYDLNNPFVQAIERGYANWEAGNCHELGCGCVTVYIWREIAPILAAGKGEQHAAKMDEEICK